MAAPLMKGLLNLLASKNSVDVAKNALPGAAVNALMGGIVAGPAGALGYGAGDFLLNYPLMRLARKISPATKELVTNVKTGKISERLSPSGLEQGANLTASLLSPLVTDLVTGGSLLPKAPQASPTDQSQSAQVLQALRQREMLNNVSSDTMPLSPGTLFQTGGVDQRAFHYPGVTFPPELLAQLQDRGMG
jgi:hypothetical protein